MTSPKRSMFGSGTVAPPAGKRCGMREVRHLPGAHQHDVAGLDGHRGQRAGGVEVRGRDGVPAVEDVGLLGPGHVEEHPAADERVHEVDPETARPRRVDRRCRVPVVERAAVAHMRQSVPMRGALQRHDDDVLVGADPFGVVGQRHVHVRHGAHRVEAARHDTLLDPLGLRQGQAHGEGPARPDTARRPAAHLVGDEVERAELVVVAPATPVPHPGGDRRELLRGTHRRRRLVASVGRRERRGGRGSRRGTRNPWLPSPHGRRLRD